MVFNRIRITFFIKSYQEKWVVLNFNGLDFPWFLIKGYQVFQGTLDWFFPELDGFLREIGFV